MPELALDDFERHALAGQRDRFGHEAVVSSEARRVLALDDEQARDMASR